MAMADPARVVLVTGATRGIGQHVARALSARGYRLAVIARPGGTSADPVVNDIRSAGGTAEAFSADASDPSSAGELIVEVERRCGPLYALVLAATPSIASKLFEETTDEELRAYLDAYAAGPFALIRSAASSMASRGTGRIVAIASSAISELPPRHVAYIAAKSAMLGLCRALAVELGPTGITVNVISPGAVADPDATASARARESLQARSYPMRRLATREDVASAVAYLLSDEAAYVSGAHIPITGGLPL